VFSPDLGRGETDVRRLALESLAGDVILILDDMRALKAVGRFGLKFTGTLGCSLRRNALAF